MQLIVYWSVQQVPPVLELPSIFFRPPLVCSTNMKQFSGTSPSVKGTKVLFSTELLKAEGNTVKGILYQL